WGHVPRLRRSGPSAPAGGDHRPREPHPPTGRAHRSPHRGNGRLHGEAAARPLGVAGPRGQGPPGKEASPPIVHPGPGRNVARALAVRWNAEVTVRHPGRGQPLGTAVAARGGGRSRSLSVPVLRRVAPGEPPGLILALLYSYCTVQTVQ